MSNRSSGTLFVVSAPSGTGKTTAGQKLIAALDGLAFSVSYTTRPPRDGERVGRDYHFVDQATFQHMIDEKAFLEWARVFDHMYGTGIEETQRILDTGSDLLLDIDVQGARQVREGPIPAVSMMILPPDYATLEARLADRNSESAPVRCGRLARARLEAEDYTEFGYVVVNDDIDRTVAELVAIVGAERRRPSRCSDEIQKIISTFPV